MSLLPIKIFGYIHSKRTYFLVIGKKHKKRPLFVGIFFYVRQCSKIQIRVTARKRTHINIRDALAL